MKDRSMTGKVLNRWHNTIIIMTVLCIVSTCCLYSDNTKIPTSYKWLNQWKTISAFPELMPILHDVDIKLDISDSVNSDDSDIGFNSVELIDRSERNVGTIAIDKNWQGNIFTGY